MSISIAYTELREGGGEGGIDQEGGYARRVLKCEYELAQQMCYELVGGIIPSGINAYYKAPEKHPRNPRLLCISANFVGYGPCGNNLGVITFPYAKVYANYGPPNKSQNATQPPSSTVIMKERRDIGGNVVTINGGSYKWASGPKSGDPIREPPGIIVPEITWYLDVYYLRSTKVSDGTFDAAIGKINSSSFSMAYSKFPAKTLMFEGAVPERSFVLNSIGDILAEAWNVTFQFGYKANGWHKLLDDSGTWQEFQTSSGGDPYPTTSFNTLFNW